MRGARPDGSEEDEVRRSLAAEAFLAFSSDPREPLGSFLRRFAAAHGVSRAPRTLDVGVGPGRLFPLFRELGWRVVGLEPDPDYLDAARRAAEDAGMPPVQRGGFADIVERDAFEVVTAINDPVSHLLTPRARRDAFGRVLRALVPGGAFLFDVPHFAWILRNYRAPPERTAPVPGGEVRVARRHEIDRAAGTFTTLEDVAITRDGRTHRLTKRFCYAMTSPSELEGELRAVGFASVRTHEGYGSLEPGPVTGPRIVVSAERPR